jgi:hypothetical protein
MLQQGFLHLLRIARKVLNEARQDERFIDCSARPDCGQAE